MCEEKGSPVGFFLKNKRDDDDVCGCVYVMSIVYKNRSITPVDCAYPQSVS